MEKRTARLTFVLETEGFFYTEKCNPRLERAFSLRLPDYNVPPVLSLLTSLSPQSCQLWKVSQGFCFQCPNDFIRPQIEMKNRKLLAGIGAKSRLGYPFPVFHWNDPHNSIIQKPRKISRFAEVPVSVWQFKLSASTCPVHTFVAIRIQVYLHARKIKQTPSLQTSRVRRKFQTRTSWILRLRTPFILSSDEKNETDELLRLVEQAVVCFQHNAQVDALASRCSLQSYHIVLLPPKGQDLFSVFQLHLITKLFLCGYWPKTYVANTVQLSNAIPPFFSLIFSRMKMLYTIIA